MQYIQISQQNHNPTGKAFALYETYTVTDPVAATPVTLKRIIGYYNLADLQSHVAELQAAVVTVQTPAPAAAPAAPAAAAPAAPATT